MKFITGALSGIYLIEPTVFGDDRGWFMRTFCRNEFAAINFTGEWVQMNHSFTKKSGTVRGLHYQNPPYSEIKLVRCVAGKVFDVVVDIRKDSPSFLQWMGVELSAENKMMIVIPQGFAHGFQTLSANTELVYNHSEYYKPDAEAALFYADPALNIQWPLPVGDLSERDKNHPLLTNNFKGI